jgi:hypothetical protein
MLDVYPPRGKDRPLRLAPLLAAGVLAMALPATAAERSEADFVAACRASSNLSQEICACSAKRAKEELSPDGFAFLVATLEQDDAATASLRGKLPLDQTMKAATFMTRGPARCAKDAASASE